MMQDVTVKLNPRLPRKGRIQEEEEEEEEEEEGGGGGGGRRRGRRRRLFTSKFDFNLRKKLTKR
jgi:hypothetical protein